MSNELQSWLHRIRKFVAALGAGAFGGYSAQGRRGIGVDVRRGPTPQLLPLLVCLRVLPAFSGAAAAIATAIRAVSGYRAPAVRNREIELNKPVDTTGEITESGDPTLDGKVTNAIEMIQKLAESKRTEQVFVRHAFRFWMGRNETPNDAPVLQEAYRAYHDSSGSMKALLTSLLTSDAFLYRKVEPPVNSPAR